MKLEIDHKSPVPLHIQAENLLRKLIEQPDYKGGQYLPSEIDLSRKLGISRSTLRQSINKLVYDGLLVRRKGIGTRVAGPSVSSRSNNWLSFSQEMAAKGIKVKNFELLVSWEYPDKETAAFFNIADDKKILKLARIRGKKEGPFVYFISYFNPRIGMTGDEDFTQPLYEILEKQYSIVVKLSKEEISARAADSFLAKKLDLSPGDPILVRKRFVFDTGQRPVEYNLGYYKADSFVYTVESER
jgi:GntR family transcriptional regulator